MLRDGKGQDNEENIEHAGNNAGDLDVLLKSLWEGEEEIVSNSHWGVRN